ncbi:MAG TPA: metalloregulator ArsR/SmtB family transcription factor [Nocardioidaceae bacterium]|nr:metalloregulator ArsR/SmtB family transcription factor [Nocardioidaceae bacterium]
MAKVHGVTTTSLVTVDDADEVARVMAGLASASRVRILAQLRRGPSSVGDLAESVELAQPAVSQHLRVLRDIGLVTGSRQGRNTVYELNDPHVQSLVDEALRHVDHLRGAGDPSAHPPESDDR